MSEYYVYILHDTEGKPAYIGMTKNLTMRIAIHRRRHGWFHFASHQGPYTRDEAMRQERALVNKHQPVHNTYLKVRPAPIRRSAGGAITTTVSMTQAMKDRIATEAEREGHFNLSAVVNKALSEYFERLDKDREAA